MSRSKKGNSFLRHLFRQDIHEPNSGRRTTNGKFWPGLESPWKDHIPLMWLGFAHFLLPVCKTEAKKRSPTSHRVTTVKGIPLGWGRWLMSVKHLPHYHGAYVSMPSTHVKVKCCGTHLESSIGDSTQGRGCRRIPRVHSQPIQPIGEPEAQQETLFNK